MKTTKKILLTTVVLNMFLNAAIMFSENNFPASILAKDGENYEYEFRDVETWLKIGDGKYGVPLLDRVLIADECYKIAIKKNEVKSNRPVEENSTKTFTNSQLAIIGRILINAAVPDENMGIKDFEMHQEKENELISSFGTGASIVKVEKTAEGIIISKLNYYNSPSQRNFMAVAQYSYSELGRDITAEEISKINNIINLYKQSSVYEKYHIVD